MRELGFYPSKLLISQVCSQADPERMGVVKRKDFLEIMRKMITIKKPTEADIKNAFAVFDKEKNGFIPTAHLRFSFLVIFVVSSEFLLFGRGNYLLCKLIYFKINYSFFFFNFQHLVLNRDTFCLKCSFKLISIKFFLS